MDKKMGIASVVILSLLLAISIYGNFFNKSATTQNSVQTSIPAASPSPRSTSLADTKPMQSSKAEPEFKSDGKSLSLKMPTGKSRSPQDLTEAENIKIIELLSNVLKSTEVSSMIQEKALKIAIEDNLEPGAAITRAMFDGSVQALIVSKLKPDLSGAPTYWDDKMILAFSLLVCNQLGKRAADVEESLQQDKSTAMETAAMKALEKTKAELPELFKDLNEQASIDAMSEVLKAYNNADVLATIEKITADAIAAINRPLSPTEAARATLAVLQNDKLIKEKIIPLVKDKLSKPPYNWSEANIIAFIKKCCQVTADFD